MPYISESSADGKPAVACLNDCIYVVYKKHNSDRFEIASHRSLTAGSSWTYHEVPERIPGSEPNLLKTSRPPEMVAFNGELWIAFIGHTNSKIWLVSWNPTSNTWTGRGRISNADSTIAVALHYHPERPVGNRPILCFRDDTENEQLWWSEHGEDNRAIPGCTRVTSPVLADISWTRQHNIYAVPRTTRTAIAYTSSEDERVMVVERVQSSPHGEAHWSRPVHITDAWSRDAPALAFHQFSRSIPDNSLQIPQIDLDNQPVLLYAAFRSSTANDIWIASYDGGFWKLQGTVPGQYTGTSPALVSFDHNLYVFCTGHNNNYIWYRRVPIESYLHIYFHPIPHYFKMGDLSTGETGIERRQGLENGQPSPQSIYPQCIPAGWARLLGAYQIVLPPAQRRWEVGNASEADPSPADYGDHISTHIMGTCRPEDVSPLASWPSRTPLRVESYNFSILDPGESAIRMRADKIDARLKQVLKHAPVYIQHEGHGWNIMGCNALGYYSHGQNGESEGLMDWCAWRNSPWRNTDERFKRSYQIFYIKDHPMKPYANRLGSLGFWIWVSDRDLPGSHNIKFINLHEHGDIEWTPHMTASAQHSGYIWITQAGSSPDLDRNGLPVDRDISRWHSSFGQRIPVPHSTRRNCTCRSSDGCPRCRIRLQLTFWVHNTTLETQRYRVSLQFATNDGWRDYPARPIQPTTNDAGNLEYPCFDERYPDWYENTFPLKAPNERFSIRVRRDPSDDPAGREPDGYDWQPFGWHVDFYREVVQPDSTYGIRLVLGSDNDNRVQDIKQLWFHTAGS
ncbi:MAG: hypothetical protein JXR76_24560 [Deltaproteobacteria bacterium]|nr:hypothetical protein [Deltaproteobacteria bacterium]